MIAMNISLKTLESSFYKKYKAEQMLQIKMLYKLLRDHQDVKVGYCQMEDRVGFL